ncbi:MAG: hypothetical protein AAGA18_09190 [Verrucomicrobiota bacterium]
MAAPGPSWKKCALPGMAGTFSRERPPPGGAIALLNNTAGELI